MDLKVTSLEELKEIAKGEIVSIPGFTSDKPFIIRVKRPSLLGLIQQGVIPNTLLGAANELFYGKKSNKSGNNDTDMAELTKVMTIMAESALLEPTPDDLKEVGLSLTDEQIVSLFNYTQKGLDGIAKFPANTSDNVSADNSQALQTKAESDN